MMDYFFADLFVILSAAAIAVFVRIKARQARTGEEGPSAEDFEIIES